MDEMQRLRNRLQKQEAELRILDAFNERVSTLETTEDVILLLTETVLDLCKAQSLAVFLAKGQELEPIVLKSPQAERLENAPLFGFSEPVIEKSWESGKSAEARYRPEENSERVFCQDEATAAFCMQDRGVLYVGCAEAQELPAGTSRLLAALARQAGLALTSVERFQSLQAAYRQLEESESHLVQQGKMAAVGQLAAGVAHELNTPLATVLLEAEALELEFDNNDEVKESLQTVVSEVVRAQGIVESLLYYSRDAGKGDKSTDLNQVASDTERLIGSQLRQVGIEVKLDLSASSSHFKGNGNEIQQILLNLLLNARDVLANKANGSVQIQTSCEAGLLRVSVSDNGPGIPDEVRERIFEPFFTTKSVGKGTGLGLSVSRNFAERHGGSLILENTDGGCRFVLTLPVLRSDAS